MAQSVTLQSDFSFKLFPTEIAEMVPLHVVPVHVSLQVTATAAGVVTQAAGVRLQTCRSDKDSDRTF